MGIRTYCLWVNRWCKKKHDHKDALEASRTLATYSLAEMVFIQMSILQVFFKLNNMYKILCCGHVVFQKKM
jgi:hypothetical protein